MAKESTTRKILKVVKRMITIYILFALISCTLPWLPFWRGRMDEGFDAPSLEQFFGEGTGPDRVMLFEQPQDAFAIRMAMIRGATKTLDIVYYAIQSDASGRAFLGEVLRAADRGVTVRILLDGTINAMGDIAKHLRALETHPNITCRRYNPVHLLKPWQWQALLHDKLILVDGRHLLTGGRNVGDRFFALEGYTGKITYDRDIFVTSTGGADSVTGEMGRHINRLWAHKASKPVRAAAGGAAEFTALLACAAQTEEANAACYAMSLQDYVAQTLPTQKVTLITNPIHTGKKYPVIGHALQQLAEEARHSVIIQTPYATANRTLLKALSTIDSRAETVLLTNSVASSPNTIAFSNYYTTRRQFLQTGVDLFELQSRDSMHGKSMVLDHRLSVVGSLNLDDRSLFIDTENMLVIDSEPFAAVLRGSMDTFARASLQVGMDLAYLPGEVAESPVHWGKRAMLSVVSVFSRLFQYLV